MKCIVLYGPPAVGKQTVAHELLKLINARLFDAVKITDTVQQFISRDNPEFVGLVYSLQLQIINAAMRLGTQDIIIPFTFSANSQSDGAFLQTMHEAGQRHNVAVEFIQLTAKKRVLLERVSQESRKAAGKLTDPAILTAMLDQYDMESPYPSEQGTTINTTHMTPQEAAQQIVRTIQS